MYAAFNAPEQYYIFMGPVRAYSISLHYVINGTIFEKKIIEHKCFFNFSAKLPETFLILRRIQRHMIINVYRPSCKVPVIIVRF